MKVSSWTLTSQQPHRVTSEQRGLVSSWTLTSCQPHRVTSEQWGSWWQSAKNVDHTFTWQMYNQFLAFFKKKEVATECDSKRKLLKSDTISAKRGLREDIAFIQKQEFPELPIKRQKTKSSGNQGRQLSPYLKKKPTHVNICPQTLKTRMNRWQYLRLTLCKSLLDDAGRVFSTNDTF